MHQLKTLTHYGRSTPALLLGIWLWPLAWMFSGLTPLLGWGQILVPIFSIPAVLIFIVCSRSLSKRHALLKRELSGWGPLSSFFPKKGESNLDESERWIMNLAYQRAYAILLTGGLVLVAAIFILSLVSPHLEIAVVGTPHAFLGYLYIVLALVSLLWILPATFVVWQLAKE